MRRFGRRLREHREGVHKTLKEVAQAMGWSVVYLSDIERGRRNPPSPDHIRRLAEILNIDPSALLRLASQDREKVELDLVNKSPKLEEAALMLARSWEGLSDEEADQILKILEKGGTND